MTADGVRHRARMGGIAICGAKARDGAKFAVIFRHITCPTCRGLIVERRAAAKARAPQ